MNKCIGCGDLTERDLCERCFRIKNYNDYKLVVKDNSSLVPILNNIDEKDLVLLVMDLFNIKRLKDITKYIKNEMLLVLTKRDLLPEVFEEKLLNYDYGEEFIDKIIISSKKNYQFDELLEKIKKYKKSEKVYVVGYTNSGKSTMINKLIYNYSTNVSQITTSPLPNTTLNIIEVRLDDNLVLLDTPGLLDEGDITNFVDGQNLKKLIPSKKVKPITYQIKNRQIIIVDNYLIIEAENIDLTLFFSNLLSTKRIYKDIPIPKNFKRVEVNIDKNDIVVDGMGFIKTNKKGIVIIYTLDGVKVFTRKSLI